MRTRFTVAVLLGLLSLGASSQPAQAEDEVAKIEREYGIVGTRNAEGRRLNRQLERVVDRIVSAVHETKAGRDFQLRSAKLLGGASENADKAVNAFALPDGRIYVTLGLMRMIQDSPDADDELAFVVGHEVTHVVQKHSIGQQKKALPVGIAAILLGAVTKNKAVGGLGQLGAAAYASHYGREDEYRADKGGLRAMNRAGYDPEAAITMLKRLGKLGGQQNKTLNGWMGSHPISENRVARVKELITELPQRGGR